MVMYAGQVMEERAADDLFASPQHPYTAALLAALPEHSHGGRLATIPGVVPGLYDRPRGCLFSPRCAYATEHSRNVRPDLRRGQAARSAAITLSGTRSAKPALGRPSGRRRGGRIVSAPVIEAHNLKRVYEVRRGLFKEPGRLQAVGGVSFTLQPGKTLAVVGESGCGKSTLARMATLIEKPTEGTLNLDGIDAIDPPAGKAKGLRRTVQLVFQNPYGSLNPRKKVGAILEEPLAINTKLNGAERSERARAMMAKVGLRPEHYNRYPHMFSGGQRQRIAIARALML